MCRLLGYLGAPIPLGKLVNEPPHSLFRQSWQPRELREATVNADGWGAGFYVEGDLEPCLYRSTVPIWADANVPHLGRAIRSSCLLAAVRSATDPLSVAQANTQPFASGPLAFLHNGFIEDFRRRLRRRLCDELSDARHTQIEGTSDSEHVFALIGHHLDRRLGQGPRAEAIAADVLLDAVRGAVHQIMGWAREAEAKALFSIAITDGVTLVALRASTHPDPPTLYLLGAGSALAPGVVVASERLNDDPAWRSVPPGTAVVVEAGGAVREVPLA